jgi:hypothetical protein
MIWMVREFCRLIGLTVLWLGGTLLVLWLIGRFC